MYILHLILLHKFNVRLYTVYVYVCTDSIRLSYLIKTEWLNIDRKTHNNCDTEHRTEGKNDMFSNT